MRHRIAPIEYLLAGVVILHLGVNVFHGVAHVRAHVALSAAAMLFVFTVVLIGPMAGLAAEWTAYPRGGAAVIAVTLAGSFFFGVANHFLIRGDDHVGHVAERWRPLFGITAGLLAATEFLGAAVAVWCVARAR